MIQTILDPGQFLTKNGKRDGGRALRYWRKQVIQWHNTKIIVELLNEALEDNYSTRWWQRMEKENKVPPDLKRRWLITTILHLPAAYFGLSAPSFLEESAELKLPLPGKSFSVPRNLDLKMYDRNLIACWSKPYDPIERELIDIYALQDAFLCGKSPKEVIGRLLCEYLVAASYRQRAQGFFSSAILNADKALHIARDQHYYDIAAKAAYIKSFSFAERWDLRPTLDNEDLMHSALAIEQSNHYLKQAKEEKIYVNPQFESAITASLAMRKSYFPQDNEDKHIILDLLKQAQKTSKRGFSDAKFLKVDDSWFILGRSQILLTMGEPKTSIKELAELGTGDPRVMRRYLTSTIVEAEAYAAQGKADMAAVYAEDAANIAYEVSARPQLARIEVLYSSLRSNEKFAKNPEVVRLGITLLKMRLPSLFK